MTPAFPAGQPLSLMTSPGEEICERCETGSIIGVVGKGEIRRTTEARGQTTCQLKLGDEIGISAE